MGDLQPQASPAFVLVFPMTPDWSLPKGQSVDVEAKSKCPTGSETKTRSKSDKARSLGKLYSKES